MIPKKLHFIWIGDESKMPKACINTWVKKNPKFDVRIWGNKELKTIKWKNAKQLKQMLKKKDYAGASDIMRYEILYKHGGVFIDADSYCMKALPNWLLECEAFACWENEIIRNNLIANGYIGGVPKAPVWKTCIDEIATKDCSENKLAWMITGPWMLSDIYFKKQPNITIYPSHFFIQDHHTGHRTNVTGHYFANHMWGSEIGYDNMDEAMRSKQ